MTDVRPRPCEGDAAGIEKAWLRYLEAAAREAEGARRWES
jgi:hypothetical protein